MNLFPLYSFPHITGRCDNGMVARKTTPRARMVFRGIVAMALIGASTFPLSSQSPTTLIPSAQPIPPSYFSMNLLFHPKNHVPWPSVPVGGWRTSHADWADIQPQRGQWYFDLLDKYVDMSVEHHVPILMVLTYTPAWASSTPDAESDKPTSPGNAGPPTDINDWRNYVRTVATRYKGRIRNWEIWNEPNRPKSWNGSPGQMVQMAKEAYTILKQIDPGCTIVSPAPEELKGLAFFQQYLAAGGGKYADVIGYHFYVNNDPPEAMVPFIQQARTIMTRNGLGDKPLWDTEAGWLSPPALLPDIAAGYVARAEILNWAAGVSRFYWFAWEAKPVKIELIQHDFTNLTPAGQAFGTIQKWLSGKVLYRCDSSKDDTWVCEVRDQGRSSHIVWNASHTTMFQIPAAWRVQSMNTLAGQQLPVTGPSIQMGQQPVWLQ